MAYLILGYAAAFMTQAPTLEQSALQGAKIGFVIYGVFDFTSTFMVCSSAYLLGMHPKCMTCCHNYERRLLTVGCCLQYNGWTLKTALLDTCWGTVMYALIGWLLSYLSTTELWQRL